MRINTHYNKGVYKFEMGSILLITPVENLQKRINETLSSFQDTTPIYVSLNKSQKSTEEILRKAGIKTKKIFFIDCTKGDKEDRETLHIHPRNLESLKYAIKVFIKKIKEKKSILIDSLSTLLIYNSEKEVAAFTKEITEYASDKNVEIIALSPKTEGEELLNKVFNFFSKVIKK